MCFVRFIGHYYNSHFDNIILLRRCRRMSDRPLPVKVCFLKNQIKRSVQKDEVKVSLSFLSAFIQQEKMNRENQMHKHSQLLITSTNLTDDGVREKLSVLEPSNLRTSKGGFFQKWKLRKSLSHSDDKRFLTNIVGNDWMAVQKAETSQVDSKLKANARSRWESFEESRRMETNRQLLKTQFDAFVSEKSANLNRPNEKEQKELKFIATKADERFLRFASSSKKVGDQNRKYKSRNSVQLSFSPEKGNKAEKGKSQKRPNTLESKRRRTVCEFPSFKWSVVDADSEFRLHSNNKNDVLRS